MIQKAVVIFLCSIIGVLPAVAQFDKNIQIDRDLQLIYLKDSVYVHVSWHQDEVYGRFPSNGLIFIKNGKALMVDTPMDNDKTERLTRYLMDTLAVEVTQLIIGHFHDDCLGGLAYIQQKGIASIANRMTIEKCIELGLPVPAQAFTDSLTINFNGEKIVCRFFGAGHSPDNIIVWIPNKKILFGGCLIKSMHSRDLGNLSDAVVSDWDFTINKIIACYPDIEIVIPGHGAYGGPELLMHTIKLVKAYKNK